MELDINDPVEAVLAEMAAMNRKKRADYSVNPDSDPFGNFRLSTASAATRTPMSVSDGIEFNIAQKDARLVALYRSGREPRNESVEDTLMDRAVYSTIAVAWHRYDQARRRAAGAAPTVALQRPVITAPIPVPDRA